MANRDEAEAVIKALDDSELDGRRIRVNEAKTGKQVEMTAQPETPAEGEKPAEAEATDEAPAPAEAPTTDETSAPESANEEKTE